MSIKEMRKASGMTQKAFSEYFGIPKRSIENWEGEKRECPAYLLELMEYKLRNEHIIEKDARKMMKSSLVGRRVFITDKESMYFDEWGIIDSYDGEYYYVRIANGRSEMPAFTRKEFKVRREKKTGE